MKFNLRHFSADQLFDVEKVKPREGHPPWQNLKFRKKKLLPRDFVSTGAGVYFIFLEDKLIYVGVFRGEKTNLQGGNILDARWYRHLSTLSLRGKDTTMSASQITKLFDLFPDHEVVRDLKVSNLNCFGHKGGRGCVTTVRRASVALAHWRKMKTLSDKTLESFSFAYARVLMSETHSIASGRKLVGDLEKQLIRDLRPCGNTGVDPNEVHSNVSLEIVEEALTRLLD